MRKYSIILYILVFWLVPETAMAQESIDIEERDLDSLVSLYYSHVDDDEDKLIIARLICQEQIHADSIQKWAQINVDLARKLNNPNYEVLGLLSLAVADYYHADFQSSLNYGFQGLSIAESIGNKERIADCCQNIGDAYSYLNAYEKANSYYYRTLDINMECGDIKSFIFTIYSLTDNLIIQKLFNEADSLLKLGDSLALSINNDYARSFVMENLAMLYYSMFVYHFSECDLGLIEKVKYYAAESIRLEETLYRGDVLYLRSLFFESVYNDYKGARLDNALDSMRIINDHLYANAIEDQGLEVEVDWEINNVFIMLLAGEFDEAIIKLDSIDSLAYGTEYESAYLLIRSHYYSLQGDFRNSQFWLSKYYESINSTISLDMAVSTAQNLAENNYKDQIRERELRYEQKRRRYLLIVIAVLVGLAFLVSEYVRNRRHNRELNVKNLKLLQQREEILSQKEEILAMNEELSDKNATLASNHKQITDSISYASLIQKAALPKDYQMSDLFGDYFLIYRPLDIVAGDFYWASQIGRYKILVCADCTGHGVPGAFVSMLGISLLNEVSSHISDMCNAACILDDLRTKLMNSLGQSKKKYENGTIYSMDGMDLAMVVMEDDSNVVQFAGAYRPLWIWRNGELIQLKPDKMPIGLYLGSEKNFTNHELEVFPGDVLYMFSDGIPDQFGFVDDSRTRCKHFSTKKLAKLITDIGHLPLTEQKSRIEHEVDTWKNGYKQLDDNILIGVRV